jgi:flagellar biogenesis protein FliO
MDLAFQMIAVIAVLAAMAAGLWALNRRRSVPEGQSDLRLEGRVPLTPNHSLHIVRFQGSHLLVATHPGGCTLLQHAGKPANEASV